MRFSQHFGISRTQAELDFVDVDPSQDQRLFIDPPMPSRRPIGLIRLLGKMIGKLVRHALAWFRET